MSSTEQKNVTQPFLDSCYTFGTLPTILTQAFDNYELKTEHKVFGELGTTPELGNRLRDADSPHQVAVALLPSLRNAGCVTRVSPLLLKLCSDSRTFTGNQAVLRLSKGITMHRWGLHFPETAGYKHAKLHTPGILSALAPGSYSNFERASKNAERIIARGNCAYLRLASELFDFIRRQAPNAQYATQVRGWCHRARAASCFKPRYTSIDRATKAYNEFDPTALHNFDEPPAVRQKWITCRKDSITSISVYQYANHFFLKITSKFNKCHESTLFHPAKDSKLRRVKVSLRRPVDTELYVLSHRDLEDLAFLLHAGAQILMYNARRLHDVLYVNVLQMLKAVQEMLWSLYMEVMGACGSVHSLRNKLGVYFDVLQWRYLAWRSGNEFYDHSAIMGKKISSKGLSELPSQDMMLLRLRDLPMDISVDLLGIYKASIYPEVDPFKVVAEQYDLHYSRFQTNWKVGSPEYDRFQDTRSYMWYFGVRTLYQRRKVWPGRIRAGVTEKDWHEAYHRHGIPGKNWRDAHDIDLSNCVPVSDISDEQYLKQQDSACAPPLKREYESFETLKDAPRRHRRKLLYSIQEVEMPSLSGTINYLNKIGSELPDGHVDPVAVDLAFSTDIVTGSRCERHKDAPRPFYAACPPWGCIISYFDGITRDFLSNVPQSMLGKSTKQKFTDIASAERVYVAGADSFYMSDDKAKYSPRMDPNSQQLPADFFAELFGIPAIKAYGPIMYHCNLYYRVCGHLVSYNSNGTDREGMRGASNTWLEIVAQGLSTRLSRDRGLIEGKSQFLSFIDDGLRKFSVKAVGLSQQQVHVRARKVIDDVVFGLKVLGRELSWDKTFISRDLFVILNEIMFEGSHISSGLKSFVTAGDIEMKEVMTAADYEQLYFGKMRGAHGVGAPLDLCHLTYVFETTLSHFKMGVNLQNNKGTTRLEYRLFCITPIALGGAGIRSMLQMGCNESANATHEGIGTLMRLASDKPVLRPCIQSLLTQPLEPLNPVDFMREPSQFHVSGPRIKTQRLAAEVRRSLRAFACNDLSKKYLLMDELGMQILAKEGKALMLAGALSAEEVRLVYAMSPVSFIDEFVQKLASSTTLSELIGKFTIGRMRRQVRNDLITALDRYRRRLCLHRMYDEHSSQLDMLASIEFLH